MMERLVLIIISAFIFGLAFISCENAGLNEKMELYVIGIKSGAVPTSEKDDLIFTGDDIKSFNVISGEIVFSDKKIDQIISRASLYSEFRFFIYDKPVFDPPIPSMKLEGDRFCGSPLPWAYWNDLGLLILNSKNCYLLKGYEPWYSLSPNEKQEENSKRRKKELDYFIEYLSRFGKIVE